MGGRSGKRKLATVQLERGATGEVVGAQCGELAFGRGRSARDMEPTFPSVYSTTSSLVRLGRKCVCVAGVICGHLGLHWECTGDPFLG